MEGQEGLVGLVPLLRVDLLLALGNGLGLGRVEAEEVVGVHLARRGRRLVLAGILGSLSARELAISVFLFITAPVSAHLLSKVALKKSK